MCQVVYRLVNCLLLLSLIVWIYRIGSQQQSNGLNRNSPLGRIERLSIACSYSIPINGAYELATFGFDSVSRYLIQDLSLAGPNVIAADRADCLSISGSQVVALNFINGLSQARSYDIAIKFQ